jgi:hypothetical protein
MRTGAFQTFLSWQRNSDRKKVRHTSCQLTPKSRQRRKEKGASDTDDETLGGSSANLTLGLLPACRQAAQNRRGHAQNSKRA